MFKSIWKAAIAAVYPVRCPYCQDVISHDKTCCDNCNRSITRHLERVKVFDEDENNFKSYCFTPLRYDGAVKQAIWRFKFRGCKCYCEHFSDEIIKGLKDTYYNLDFDVITFVPMSKIKKSERGYNQSEALAKKIGEKLNVDCKSLLIKARNNKPQHDLDALERVSNVKGAYSVDDTLDVKGKKILLCDDVFTTGNTLKECCRVLYEAGATCVECVAIAHTELN